ncbi:MAG: hydrogenase maturation protease [Alphaproteobacteria bacterium]
MTARALVIGVGQPWRGDDAFGLEVAERLRGALPAGVDVITHPGEGTGLMDAWEGYARVVVIDAARGGAPIGTMHRFDCRAQTLPTGFFRYSTHAFGLAEAVETARALGRLPPALVVHAVEGAVFTLGLGLSPEVAARVDQVVDAVRGELRRD